MYLLSVFIHQCPRAGGSLTHFTESWISLSVCQSYLLYVCLGKYWAILSFCAGLPVSLGLPTPCSSSFRCPHPALGRAMPHLAALAVHGVQRPLQGRGRALEAAQGAPRDPRRDSRGERSPWLPLETRPDSPGPSSLSLASPTPPHPSAPTHSLCTATS